MSAFEDDTRGLGLAVACRWIIRRLDAFGIPRSYDDSITEADSTHHIDRKNHNSFLRKCQYAFAFLKV